jgi:hypothetical protein
MAETLQMLSEHESAKELNTTNPAGYTPSEDEKKTLKLVDELLEKSKRHKKPYSEHWLDWYKMFRGKQWKEQRPSYRHSEVINMIFQSIQGSVPLQTDSRPKISFLPTEPSDMEFSEVLNKVCESDWERHNWLQTLTESIYDSNFYGTGFGSMEIEQGPSGLPKICYESADPFYCFPDPAARDVNEKRSRYFIYAEPVDLSVLKREYPKKAQWVKADLLDSIQDNKVNLDLIKYKSPVDNKTTLEGTSAYELHARDQALKVTCWLLSDEFDENKKETPDPQTGEIKVEYEQRLKYPKGRKIVVASGVVLEDGPNPYEDGKFPYARLVNYLLPREFWGGSEVEQLESPQKIFNKVLSFMLDIMTLTGNPIWVIDNTSGIDTDNMVNRPGLIVEKEPGSTVERQQGLEINPSLFQLVDRVREYFNGVSGNQEVTQGRNPEGVTAMGAITALQEAAQTRLRLKSRHLDAHLQDLGQMYASRVFQAYSAPQVFRLTNNQNASQFFKMHIAPVLDEAGQPVMNEDGAPKRKAIVRGYLQAPDSSMSEDPVAKEFEVRAKFDVRANTGSSLPFAKVEKFAQAKEMFQLGAIDQQALLESSDFPNWEAILARMQAAQAEQQQAQMQAAQDQEMMKAQAKAQAQGMPGAPPNAA